MKYETECPKCGHKILFTNKDLKKLSNHSIKLRQKYAEILLGILKGKRKRLKLFPFPHFKEENYQMGDWLNINKTAKQVKAQRNFIRCGICNQEIVV